MKLEDMTKGYLLALYSNIESLLAKDSSWGVIGFLWLQSR